MDISYILHNGSKLREHKGQRRRKKLFEFSNIIMAQSEQSTVINQIIISEHNNTITPKLTINTMNKKKNSGKFSSPPMKSNERMSFLFVMTILSLCLADNNNFQYAKSQTIPGDDPSPAASTINYNHLNYIQQQHQLFNQSQINQQDVPPNSMQYPQNNRSHQQQQPKQESKPNYIETSKQITAILNGFFQLGYDKRVRPNYGGPPVEVNVTMRILSISSVSEVMMDFTADFYFRQTWHDPRLAFTKLNDIKTLYVGAEVSKKIWLPDTFFGNEKMAYFHEATTPNVFLRIDHSGEVYRSIRLTVTSSCPMNLQYFPMDRQRCTIEAESYGYNIKDIIYRWSSEVERDELISLPQFEIVKTVQKYRLEELSSGTYSRLIAELHFARRMGYYLIQIYIPSSLIVVISWVSFWLHRNASPARVQLGVTTVLTMTTLMSSTNAALPKISYIKSIDIFLGTCFIMVFAALLEYATVGYLGKRIAMRKAHLQHAQSQAQARTFAQLQAQGAQGDPIPPVSHLLDSTLPSSLGESVFISTLSSAKKKAGFAADRLDNYQADEQQHNPNAAQYQRNQVHAPKTPTKHQPANQSKFTPVPPQYSNQDSINVAQCQAHQRQIDKQARNCNCTCCHKSTQRCHSKHDHQYDLFANNDYDEDDSNPNMDFACDEQPSSPTRQRNQHHRHRTSRLMTNGRGAKVADCRASCTIHQQQFEHHTCSHNATTFASNYCNHCDNCQRTKRQLHDNHREHYLNMDREIDTENDHLDQGDTMIRLGPSKSCNCKIKHQASLPNLYKISANAKPSHVENCCHHETMDEVQDTPNTMIRIKQQHHLDHQHLQQHHDSPHHHHHHHHVHEDHNHQQQQPILLRPPMRPNPLPLADVPLSVPSPGDNRRYMPQANNQNQQANLAATAAAATLINLHRKNKGLPPSTNPNFAQFKWPFNKRSVETIFGVRPSDIDKYSRVVFPVCFLCFQLMYWIIYLHISALGESI